MTLANEIVVQRQDDSENDRVVAVNIRDDQVFLTVSDGRIIGNPLAWHPWLAQANTQQQANVEKYILSAYWPELDNGLDVLEMLKGIPYRFSAANNNPA